MPASKHTDNFNFPIYESQDRFSILGDFNNTMRTLDEELGGVKATASSAERDATSALTVAKAAQDDATAARSQTGAALSTAADAKRVADSVSTRFDDVKTAANNAVSSAQSAANVAAAARSEAESATATANNARDVANSASNIASSLDSQIDAANTTASNAVASVAKFTRLLAIRRTVVNTSEQGTTSGSTGFTRKLAEMSVNLEAEDVIMVSHQVRFAALSGVGGSRVQITAPSGNTTNLAPSYTQDYASVTGNTVSYRAPETGVYKIELRGGVHNTGASCNWANGPQVISIF